MLAPMYFQPGRNEIAVYGIEDNGGLAKIPHR